MKMQTYDLLDDSEDPFAGIEEVDETSQDDLLFPPGPIVQDPDELPLGPWAETRGSADPDDCRPALWTALLLSGALMM